MHFWYVSCSNLIEQVGTERIHSLGSRLGYAYSWCPKRVLRHV
uniref:Uncharacterized protein n=1 Tax=Arundo donax TaxID=35708 RepID=A0A0A9AB84_ARUDO